MRHLLPPTFLISLALMLWGPGNFDLVGGLGLFFCGVELICRWEERQRAKGRPNRAFPGYPLAVDDEQKRRIWDAIQARIAEDERQRFAADHPRPTVEQTRRAS